MLAWDMDKTIRAECTRCRVKSRPSFSSAKLIESLKQVGWTVVEGQFKCPTCSKLKKVTA